MSTRSEQFVESYLEATSCLVDAKIAAVAFDKTLPYSITKNDRKGKGIYTVTDNEVTFDVYSEYYDLEVGQKVYVTIPNGDFSERKFISNIIKDEEIQENRYNYRFPMDSLILDNEEIILDSESLTANKFVIDNLSEKEEENKSQCKLGEIQSYTNYLDSSLTRLVVSCRIQTLLQDYNISTGHYGFGALLLTKNLSLGYDNYEEAENMLYDLLEQNSFKSVEESVDYLNSLNQDIAKSLGKTVNYWSLHNLQVSTEDMIGNLYKFQGQQLQAKAFDVSQLNSLSFVIPYVYQVGDFQQTGLTSNFDLEYEDTPDYNIIYSDLKLSWGYAQEEYNEDALILGYYDNGLVLNENELIVKLIQHSAEENINSLARISDPVRIELDVGSFGSLVGGWNIIDSSFRLNENKKLNYSQKEINTATLMTDYKPYITLRATYVKNVQSTLTTLTSDIIYLFRDSIAYQELITTFDLYIKTSGGIVMNNFYLYDENGTILDLNNYNQAYYAEANLPLSYLKVADTISFKWTIPIKNSMIQCPLINLPDYIDKTYYANFSQLNERYFNNEIWYNYLKQKKEDNEIEDIRIENIRDESNEPNKQVTISYNEKNEICIEYTYLNQSALDYAQQSVVTYNKFYFFILREYRENKANNYIHCNINENSAARKELVFGTQSLFGSKYSFYIDSDEEGDYEKFITSKIEDGITKYNSIRLIPQLTCIRENPPTSNTLELIQKALSTPITPGVSEGIEWSLEDSNNTFLIGEIQQKYNKICYELRVDDSKLINYKRNCSLVKCRVKIEGKIYTQYYSVPIASLGSPVIDLTFNPIISYTHQGGIENDLILEQPLGAMLSSNISNNTYINNFDERYWRNLDSKISFKELNDSPNVPLTIFKRTSKYQITILGVTISNTSYKLTANTYYYFVSPVGANFLVYIGPNADYGVLMGKKESDSFYLDPDKYYKVYAYNSDGSKGSKELGKIGITRPSLYSNNNYNYRVVLQSGFLPVGAKEIFNTLSFTEVNHIIEEDSLTATPRIGSVAQFNTASLIPYLNIINTSNNSIIKKIKINKCLNAIKFNSTTGKYDPAGKYLYVLNEAITDTKININTTESQMLLSNSKNTSMDYIDIKDYTQSAYARVKIKRVGNEVRMYLPYELEIKDFQTKGDGYYMGKIKKNLSNDSDGIAFHFPNGAQENTVYRANSEIVITPTTFDTTSFKEQEEYYYLYVPNYISGTLTEQHVIQEDGLIWAIEINDKDRNGVQIVASNSNILNVIPEIGSPQLIKDGTKTTLSPYPLYIKGDQTYCISLYEMAPDNSSLKLLWHQPLIIKQNLYKEEILNNWTGELVLDDVSQLIMSSTLGAGKKDENNLFSGVFLGTVTNQTDDTPANYGIYGYTQGRQAFGFRDDGTAFIGSAGRGRILFDGNTSSITSGGYSEINPGVSLDLDDGIFDLHINTTNDGDITHATFKIQEVDMLNQENNITILEISNTDQIIGRRKSNIDLNNMEIDLKDNTINNVAKIKGEEAEFTKIIASNLNTTYGNLGTIENYEIQTNCKLQNLNLPFTIGSEEDQEKYEISIWSILNYLYIYLNNIDKDKAPTYTSLGELEDALKNMAKKIEQ